MKSNMVAMAGLSLTLDPMGKMFQNTNLIEAQLHEIPEKFGFNCPSGFSKEVF
jgi:hypothetical protein